MLPIFSSEKSSMPLDMFKNSVNIQLVAKQLDCLLTHPLSWGFHGHYPIILISTYVTCVT